MTNWSSVTELHAARDQRTGTLYLVVGPSGAGKDTIIAKARRLLGSEFFFPRRIVTREALVQAEDHETVSDALFQRMMEQGAFALSWDAHSVSYAIPSSIRTALGNGQHVVINVSREVVDQARREYRDVRVILITASPEVLSQRLRARGRETETEIAARLARAASVRPDIVIDNDGELEVALAAFLTALRG